MPEVIMMVTISGFRGDVKWPPSGQPLACDADEAADLVRAGIARYPQGPQAKPRHTATGSAANVTIAPAVRETDAEAKHRAATEAAAERSAKAAADRATARQQAEEEAAAKKAAAEAEVKPEEPVKQASPLEEIAPRRGRPPGSRNKPSGG